MWMRIAGGAILGRQRRRQPGLPALEEPPHRARPKGVADPPEGGRVVARAESVVEGDVADARKGELALGPLVAVEP